MEGERGGVFNSIFSEQKDSYSRRTRGVEESVDAILSQDDTHRHVILIAKVMSSMTPTKRFVPDLHDLEASTYPTDITFAAR